MAKYALLCGINYYNTPSQLNGCINDMLDMRSLLLKNGVPENNITCMSDDPNRNDIKPTRQEIIAQIEALGKKVQPGDDIYFSYSGHGTYDSNDVNKDESDRRDEAIYTVDDAVILDDEFNAMIRKIPVGVKTFVLMDCCHSGSILDLKEGLDRAETTRNTSNKHGFVVCVTGCQDSQTSADAYLPEGGKQPVTNRKEMATRDARGMRYRGALTASFMDLIDRKGFKSVMNAFFAGKKSELVSLRAELLGWLKPRGFTQKPNIAYEGVLTAVSAKGLPILIGFHDYNLRSNTKRPERYTPEPTFRKAQALR